MKDVLNKIPWGKIVGLVPLAMAAVSAVAEAKDKQNQAAVIKQLQTEVAELKGKN